MKSILKFLKPFTPVLLLCIALLFGQAIADLSLPNLMSDIVNIGLQRGGVEEIAPKAISREGFELLKIFMNDADRSLMENSYALVRPGTNEAAGYEGTYPLARVREIYVLTSTDEERVNAAYSSAAFAFMTFMTENMQNQAAISTEGGLADMDISAMYPMFEPLKAMPAQTFADVIAISAAMDPSFKEQVGTMFTGLFYNELGVDIRAMQQSFIYRRGFMMLLIAFASVCIVVAVGFLSSRMAAALARNLRHEIFSKVESFSSSEFDKFSTASLISRTTNDITQVQQLVAMGVRLLCYAPIMGIGGIIMAVNKSVSMSWIIALAVIVLIGSVIITFIVVFPKFRLMQEQIDKLNLVSRENLSGIMVIRAFGNQNYEENRFNTASRNLAHTQRFTMRVMAFMWPFITLLMNVVSLTVIWVGGHAIAGSQIQIGDMMAFLQYSMQIIWSFIMISWILFIVPRASVSAGRIAEVLDTEPDIKDPENPVSLPTGKRGKVKFTDVSFRYPGAEADVISNVSFTANPGETTAFIGSTGSGKSTVVNLIPRFYDATEGTVEIDGCNVKDLTLYELREAIGYVPQKGVLFSGDIRSNMLFGKEDATEDDMLYAIEVAQAKEFVEKAENGLLMEIAQGGGNVSGGQKQRLAIARALIKKPPIFIFDDSFSALDFKTDAELRKALKEYTSDSTVLIVAQRISTIMNAEQIIVLDHGKVVGMGKHAELMKTCPEYSEIAESQLALDGKGGAL